MTVFTTIYGEATKVSAVSVQSALACIAVMPDMQGVSKIGSAPANIDAALTWLQHCQRFSLTDAVPVCSARTTMCGACSGRQKRTLYLLKAGAAYDEGQ